MNKNQLFFIANLLLSTSLLLPMNANQTSNNSVILNSAFKKPESPRKNNSINFSHRALVILIPQKIEYYNANIAQYVWYSKEDFKSFKEEEMQRQKEKTDTV